MCFWFFFYHRKCTLKKIMIYLSSIQVHAPVEFHPQTLGNKPSAFRESRLVGKQPRLWAERAVMLRCPGRESKGLTLPVGKAEGQGPRSARKWGRAYSDANGVPQGSAKQETSPRPPQGPRN